MGVEEVEVGAEGLGGLDLGAAAHPDALITLQPVRRATSVQNDGPSSPWSWTHGELLALGGVGDLVERRR